MTYSGRVFALEQLKKGANEVVVEALKGKEV